MGFERDERGCDARLPVPDVSERLRRAAALAATRPAEHPKGRPAAGRRDPFARAENEDDDGYDPYSDRPAASERLFERSPWE